jgi:subtilisin-like proprotein convertase family protein/nitrous oxidase accessory protein NosD
MMTLKQIVSAGFRWMCAGTGTPSRLLIAAVSLAAIPALAEAQVRISAVYGGGGATASGYNADYVELFNAGTQPQSLAGWALQYQAAGTVGAFASKIDLSGTIQPGRYFLVRTNNTSATGIVPTASADLTSAAIDMSASTGKIVLVSSTTFLTSECATTNVVDYVGYGVTANCREPQVAGTTTSQNAPVPSTTTQISRAAGGLIDRNQNNIDFATATCAAGLLRNSSSVNAAVSQVDGTAEAGYGTALAVQNTQTGYGDSNTANVQTANGSEIDQVFGFICNNTLYVTLSGNLESNGNKVVVFVDSAAGGQTTLRGDNAIIARMGFNGGPANTGGAGMTLPASMAADYWFAANINPNLFVDYGTLPTTAAGTSTFLGSNSTFGAIAGTLTGGTSLGVAATVNNSNVLGVAAGTGPASGAGVVTGLELAIPLSAIGNPTGPVQVFAVVVSGDYSNSANQAMAGCNSCSNAIDTSTRDWSTTSAQPVTVNTNMPVITAQPPAAVAQCTGLTTTIAVTATGTGLIYQWQQSTDAGVSWIPASGTGTATATMTTASGATAGTRFRCLVATGCGVVTSSQATLSINALPVPPTGSTTYTGSVGTPISMSVTVGAGEVADWRSGNTCTGSVIFTGDLFSFTPPSAGTYQFSVNARNSTTGCTNSSCFFVTLNVPPANDVCAGATPLALNTPINGTTGGAGSDYTISAATPPYNGVGQTTSTAPGRDAVYTFTPAVTGTYSFRVSGYSTSQNPILYVVNTCPGAPGAIATANVLSANNRNSANGTEEAYCVSLTAGTQVWIVVDDLTANNAGSTFTIEAFPCAGEVEPNDSVATANTYVYGSSGMEGSTATTTDADYFSLGTPATGSRVFAMLDSLAGSSGDTGLRVTDSANTLEYDDDDGDLLFGASGFSSVIAGTPTLGTATYLRVLRSTALEPYRLFAVVQPPPINAAVEAEPNDSSATSNTSAVNYFSGTMGSSSDADFYSFNATIGQEIFIGLDCLPGRTGTAFDGALTLLDSANATLIAVNGSGSSVTATPNPGIGFTATTPAFPGEGLVWRARYSGTYYVRVTTTSTTGFPFPYLLSVGSGPAPIAGACCNAALCSVSNDLTCNSTFGTFQGSGTTCSPNPCVTGACCLTNGTCVVQLASACASLNGLYQGDTTTCPPTPACPATGSCCVAASCTITFQVQCTGAWTGGGICAPNPCVGACCNTTTGVCNLVVPASCISPDVFQGASTVCTPINPCLARCCFPDGSCTVVTSAACTTAGGTPGAGGTTCGTLTYTVTAQTNPISDDISASGTTYTAGGGGGATSLDDGSQLNVALGISPTFTFSYFGNAKTTVNISTNGFLSFGTAGMTDNSPDSPLPNANTPNEIIAPYWADLLLGSANVIHYDTRGTAPYRRFIVQWTAAPHYVSGSPQGAATFQVILYETSNAIEFRYGSITLGTFTATRAIGLENSTGTVGNNITPIPTGGPTSYLFTVSGLTCPQPSGACCVGTGCSSVSYADCQVAGGTFQGNATTCTPNPCTPPGACCAAAGSCSFTTAGVCSAILGYFQGEGVACGPTTCPTGACCLSTGVCVIDVQADCTAQGGFRWTAAGSCSPNLCVGRCCATDGTCTITTLAACATGRYGGDGSTCTGLAAGQTFAQTSGLPLAIPDNIVAGVTSTLNVAPSFSVGKVTVSVDIPHTWIGDLTLRLTHGATVVTLADRPCGNFDNLTCTFDDAGITFPCQAGPQGTVRTVGTTAGLLSAFAGADSSGDWTLFASDSANSDTGTVVAWSITLAPAVSPCQGACCVAGTCQQLSSDACANISGSYKGDASVCSAQPAPAAPTGVTADQLSYCVNAVPATISLSAACGSGDTIQWFTGSCGGTPVGTGSPLAIAAPAGSTTYYARCVSDCGGVSTCSTVDITVLPLPVAPSGAGSDTSGYCSSSAPATITLTASGGSGVTLHWFNDSCGGTQVGTGSPLVISAPATTTTYYTQWTTPCGASTCATTTVTVTPAPTVDAGSASDACAPAAVSLNGSGSNAVSYLWTGGTGTFADATNPVTTYTPGLGESGSVTLTLTATGTAPCTTAADTVAFTVSQPPTSVAGSSLTISGCMAVPVALNGSVTNAASSLWTTTGTGAFGDASNPVTTNPIRAADMAAGTVTLTLTAQPNAPCATPATSSLTLTVLPPLTTAFVDDDYVGLPNGTVVTYPAVGGSGSYIIGCNAFAGIQAALNAVTGSTVNVAPGTYDTDLLITLDNTNLVGSGAGVTTIRGVFGGDGATIRVAANNVSISGLTITRLGNNTTDWNNPALNSAGVAVQGAFTGMLVRDCVITGNRTGVDINNSSGHTLRNNAITDNRTGVILRNQTDNLTVTQNFITNNWTVGILFLDGSGGTNSPVQTAANCAFSNNDLSGNWYGQIVDRQIGGSLPAPGTNLKNFSGNWTGTASPAISTANSAEPSYATQIPVAFGGTAVPPGGQPDVLGPASANFDITPLLSGGTDTDVSTGFGTNGFQGDFSALTVTSQIAQSGSTGRVQEAHDATTIGGTVSVDAGSYSDNVVITKRLTIDGAGSGDCASGADPLTQTVISAADNTQPTITFSDVGGASTSQRLTLREVRITGSTVAGVRAVAAAGQVRSFYLFDDVAIAGNGGPGIEFTSNLGGFTDAVVTNSSLCSNYQGVYIVPSNSSFDGLSISGSEIRNNTFHGVAAYGSTASGYTPTNISLSSTQLSSNGQSSNLFQGSGDLSFFEFNGNASLTNVTINTTGRTPVQFRGQGTNAPDTWLPAGTVAINGLTITGSADRPAMYIQLYSSVTGFSLNNVDLSGITNSGPPNTAFSVAGMILDHTGASPLELGNTKFPCPGGGYASMAVYNTGGAHAPCSAMFTGATTGAQKEACVVDADDPFGLPGQIAFDDAIVLTPPAGGSVCTGGMFTFTVTASGLGPISYQWYHGVTPVGTNSNTYTISNAMPSDGGSYTVDITNACGTISTAPVSLGILPLPVAPTSVSSSASTVCSGDAFNITLTANGGSGDVVQWFTGSCGGTAIGTGNPLVVAAPGSTTTYYARWSSVCGDTACASTTVTVNPVPVAPTGAASDVSSYCGNAVPATITLTAAGGSGDTLAWYSASCGGTAVGTGSPLVIAAPGATTTYYARWETASCTPSACQSVTVTVNPAPVAPTSASSDVSSYCATAIPGGITLTASGGSGDTLEWFTVSCGGTPVGTGSPLAIAAPSVTTTYYARWSSTLCGNSGCAQVTVTVQPTPTASAGGPYSGIGTTPVPVSGTASNYSTLLWTSSGTGTFANAAALSTTYTPSPADVSGGSVTLTLTANAVAPCGVAASSMATLSITPCTTGSVVYVDDSYVGMPFGTAVNWPDNGGSGPHIIGCDAFATIQGGVNAVVAPGTVHVAAGNYNEDVSVGKTVAILGAGAGSSVLSGPIGGPGSGFQFGAEGIELAGFTITRDGNNPVDWNNPALNTAGVAIQGRSSGAVRDCLITGNRTGIDINNSSGITVRNNVITDNRTGMIFRNQTDNLTVAENAVTNNWTVGILFLDGSGGTNSPVQTAASCSFTNNDLSGNWYGQVVDRQLGGSLPAPGTNLKNFSGNWYGTASPVISTANSAEPGYAAQIPVAFGGTAVPPGGQPDVLGPASANFDITPYLGTGADTNAGAYAPDTYGFQGEFASIIVTSQIAQTGSTGRVQEGHDRVTTGGTVNVTAGSFSDSLVITKHLTIDGAGSGDCASGADPLVQTVLTAASPTLPVVTINDVGGVSAGDRLTLRELRVTGSGSGIAGVQLTSTAIRSYFLFDDVAIANNGGDGLSFVGAGGFGDVQVLDSSLCGNYRGISTATTLASFDGLTVDNCEVRSNVFNGLGMYGSTASGFNPTNITVSNSQFSSNGQSNNLFQGSGDLSFFEFNGNATITNVSIATTGRVPVQFRGRGTASPGTWLPAGTVNINGLTVTGAADRPAMYIQIYSGVTGFSLNNVDLSGITNSGPPNTAFSVAGMILDHTGVAPLQLGNTIFPCPSGGYASLAVYNTGGAHATCSTVFGAAATLAQKEACVVDADDPFGLPGQVTFDDVLIVTPPAGGAVCAGSMFTFTVSANGVGPISYQWRRSGSPVGANSNSYTITSATLGDAGNYTVDVTNACGTVTTTPVAFAVYTNPVAPASASVDSPTYCVGAVGTITLSASGGSGDVLQWFDDSCGGNLIGTGSPLMIAAPATSTTYYARWSTTNCGASACTTVSVTVNPIPGTPTSAAATPSQLCDSGNVTLTASVVGANVTVDWYSGSCGGTLVGSGASLVVPVSTTTTYYAKARNTLTGCVSPACDSTTVTVLPSPVAPSSASSSSTSYCAGSVSTITLTASGGSGDTLRWYSGTCGGTTVGTGSPLNIAAPASSTTYYARWETASCGNSTCASVAVNVQAAPTVAAGGPYTTCADGVASLTGIATNAASTLWTSSGTGTFTDATSASTVYMPSPADISAGSVTLTLTAQAIAPCTGSVSSMATLTIQPLPVAPTSASSSSNNFCQGSVANITLTASGGSGAKLAWYKDSCGGSVVGSGTPLIIPAPTTTTTYYARWINPCGASLCTSVTVTVYPNPVAPGSVTVSQNTWCSGSGPANITLGAVGGSGDTFQWFTGSCGGTAIGTGTSLVIPAPTSTTTYFGRWNTANCGSSACASVTVTVNPLPVAPTSAAVSAPNYCEGSGPANITLTALGGSGDTLKWYTGSCGGTLIGTGSPLVVAAPITTTNYFARWETTSCGASGCASVSVTVNPLPVAPSSISSSANNFCSTSIATITLTAFGGSGDTLQWFDDSCGGNLIGTGSPLNIAAPLTTTTFHARWTNTCGNSTCADLTVTVTPAVGACCSGIGTNKMCQVVPPSGCAPVANPAGAYRGNCTTCVPLSCCPADYNNSGIVSVQDIFDFLAAFFAGDFNSDFNNNTFISPQDIFDFLAAYFAGC